MPTALAGPLLTANHVGKTVGRSKRSRVLLSEASLNLSPAELTVVATNEEPAGKALAKILSGLEAPSVGSVLVNGVDVQGVAKGSRREFCQSWVTPLFTDAPLVDELTLRENMALPDRIARRIADESELAALEEALGLVSTANVKSKRAALTDRRLSLVGRALLGTAPILVAYKPTKGLPREQATQVVSLLQAAARAQRKAVLVFTDDPDLFTQPDALFHMTHGRLTPDVAPLAVPPLAMPPELPLPQTPPVDLSSADLDLVGAGLTGPAPEQPVEEAAVSTQELPRVALVHGGLDRRHVELIEIAQEILDSLPGSVAPDS